MIGYNSKYYGSAFISMIDSCQDGLTIKRIMDDKSGFYLINDKLPILCKYSTKRTNPWSFSIKSDVLDLYKSLADKYNECLIVLVCGTDGIIAIDYSDVKKIIDFNIHSKQKRIGVTRKLREMYYLTGSDGNINNKVSQKSLIEKLNKNLNTKVVEK
jgi:hypothetical protein